MLKKILYGASIHPGNLFYVVILIGSVIAGLQNETAPWWSGFLVWPFFIALYVCTSYSVGKANWPPEK